MSAAATVLPFLWATHTVHPAAHSLTQPAFYPAVVFVPADSGAKPAPSSAPLVSIPPEIAFYRKYTEGVLRRYLRCSMEAGKVPSMLGKEMFRAKVSSYRMTSFEDIIIFIHDVERCLTRLDEDQQEFIARIALQQYTIDETAELTGIRPKTVVRRYRQALDRLTRIFLSVEILRPLTAVNREDSSYFPQTTEYKRNKS
jgi:hypothetical protein